VPVAIIAAIVLIKSGGGSQVMPRQFQTLALGLVAGAKVATKPVQPRQAVTMMPDKPAAARNIVFLVDESVRGDYIDWRPGNPYTPFMAAEHARFVDFGLSVSGGNCSNSSNAILRLGGTRADLVRSINTSPTVWQYAKRAGFHTVFIDGQSGFIKNPGKLQNFMTMSEAADIDEFITFDGDVDTPDLDNRVLDEIVKRLSGDRPVFIYANKNGAHFPYDEGYPAGKAVFRPTMVASGERSNPTRVNSYRNVVRWSVDGFFARLFATADLSRTAILYTSDHGQNIADGHMTHCSTEDPDPREGLVPLMAITADAGLKARFSDGASRNHARASHFAITPTLLELMGFAPDEVRAAYGPSLFEPGLDHPAFTAGDIFGLFGNKVVWTPVDLAADYKEPYAVPLPAPASVNTVELKAPAQPIN
jgi:glucan phosphoethanolaminetransferase (alkaline phosphatase superfamily)